MVVLKIEIENFTAWLRALNYAKSTIYGSPRMVKEFLKYIIQYEPKDLENVSNKLINNYLQHLQKRKNLRRSNGGLSNNYIASHISSLRRFSKFLRETQQINIDIPSQVKQETPEKTILTKLEITAIYRACGNDILGERDRTMLNIYYGCGLRKNEGLQLDINDIHFQKQIIHVRKAKGNHERLVPINQQIAKQLENYITIARPFLIKNKNPALFLSMRGNRLCGNAMILRLKQLLEKSENPKIRESQITLHSLRHSIATHLLQSGMSLEQISKFLGHRSLESTQIYTHLANEE